MGSILDALRFEKKKHRQLEREMVQLATKKNSKRTGGQNFPNKKWGVARGERQRLDEGDREP